MERSGIEVPRCTQYFWGFSLLRNAVGWYENQEILDGNKQVDWWDRQKRPEIEGNVRKSVLGKLASYKKHVAEESRIRPVPVKNTGMNNFAAKTTSLATL